MQLWGKDGGNNSIPGLKLVEADLNTDSCCIWSILLWHLHLNVEEAVLDPPLLFSERMKLPEGQYRAFVRARIKSQSCWATPCPTNSRCHRTAF